MASPKVAVVIEPGNVLYVDGVSYGEAQVVQVTEAEAKQLVADGSGKRVRK